MACHFFGWGEPLPKWGEVITGWSVDGVFTGRYDMLGESSSEPYN